MKRLIHALASMRLAIILLTLTLVAMAAGTIVESARGADAARALVYGSGWFRLLLAAFGLNLLCSLIDLWPWGKPRIGYVMTHGSMLLILAGALVTDLYRVEGQLALWEGEESARVAVAPGPGGSTAPAAFFDLPFSVRLDDFAIDHYPGTRRPAMFRSRVTVGDPATGRSTPAVIEMNRELTRDGWHLFQSSYQLGDGRDMSILLVSRDPGQPIVFAGYLLLMIGMTTVLTTRALQHRAATPAATARPQARRPSVAAAALLPVLLALPAGAQAAQRIDGPTIAALRALPVQHDGRVMPLDTLAREAVWNITARRAVDGVDPVGFVLGVTFDPPGWANEPIVALGGEPLTREIGLPAGTRTASFASLVRNRSLFALIDRARAERAADRPLHGLLKQAHALEERLLWMHGLLERTTLLPVPDPADPNAAWSFPGEIRTPDGLLALMRSDAAAGRFDAGTIATEVRYNRVRPTRLAWWILLGATAASILAMRYRRRPFDVLAVGGLVTGFAVMTWGLGARWMAAGRIPASNMYESLLFLGWGIGLIALVALLLVRNRLIVLNATAMACLTMVLTDRLPIDPFIHPMPPVLSGTAWLAIHVPIIMLSYALLALGVLVAHLQIGSLIVAPDRREIGFRMNDILYWYLHAGSILLIAGILTGSIWAASSWGRYWGWDPKEVWSLVAFFAYVAILHARFDRLVGPFAVAALSIVAFWTILMTYIGVNYVLAAGLHSYGFGGSGVVRWLLIVGSLEVMFLGVGWLAHRASLARMEPRRAGA